MYVKKHTKVRSFCQVFITKLRRIKSAELVLPVRSLTLSNTRLEPTLRMLGSFNVIYLWVLCCVSVLLLRGSSFWLGRSAAYGTQPSHVPGLFWLSGINPQLWWPTGRKWGGDVHNWCVFKRQGLLGFRGFSGRTADTFIRLVLWTLTWKLNAPISPFGCCCCFIYASTIGVHSPACTCTCALVYPAGITAALHHSPALLDLVSSGPLEVMETFLPASLVFCVFFVWEKTIIFAGEEMLRVVFQSTSDNDNSLVSSV